MTEIMCLQSAMPRTASKYEFRGLILEHSTRMEILLTIDIKSWKAFRRGLGMAAAHLLLVAQCSLHPFDSIARPIVAVLIHRRHALPRSDVLRA